MPCPRAGSRARVASVASGEPALAARAPLGAARTRRDRRARRRAARLAGGRSRPLPLERRALVRARRRQPRGAATATPPPGSTTRGTGRRARRRCSRSLICSRRAPTATAAGADAHRLLGQALAGSALIVVLYLIAAGLAGPLAGLIAAFAAATYPPMVAATGDLVSEPLGALTLALAVLALLAAWRRPSPGASRSAGSRSASRC